jgi:hypothetical protein
MLSFRSPGVSLDCGLVYKLPAYRAASNNFASAFSHVGMPLDNIVKLKTSEPDVWRCLCGSHAFWLYSSGIACCTECEADAVAMTGYWHLPAHEANQQLQAEIVTFKSPNDR